MPGLGLPGRAGEGVGEFLEEVEKKGRKEKEKKEEKGGKKGEDEDKMDTD